MKICTKCKKEKELNQFVKRQKSKDGLSFICKDCIRKYNKQRNEINKLRYKERILKMPWLKVFYSIKQRCNNINNTVYKYYGGKGIKNFLTIDDVKFLWFRDKAYEMQTPSIGRKNHDLNYTLENCQFIELKDNISERNIRICSKTIIQMDLQENLIKEWKSIREIERQLGFKHANIINFLKGKIKTAYGFIWKYK